MIGLFGSWSNVKVNEQNARSKFQLFATSIDSRQFSAKGSVGAHGTIGLCLHRNSPHGDFYEEKARDLSVAFCGELYNFNEMASAHKVSAEKNPSFLIMTLYKKRKLLDLKKFNGLFCACIYDGKEKSLHLITDRYSSFPIHYYIGSSNFIFATSIFTLLAEGSIPRSICEIGLSQLFSLQRTLGHYTNVKDVRAMPAGSIFTIKNGRLSAQKYWHLEWQNQDLSDWEVAEKLSLALKAAVTSQTSPDLGQAGLLLSGGVDSRLVLGSSDTGKLSSWTVASYETNPELLIAEQVAKICGSAFHPIIVSPERILDWQETSTLENNGLYPASTQYSCFVGTAASECDALLSGHGLDYTLRGYYLPAKFLSALGSNTRLPSLRKLPKKINGRVILDNLRQGPPRAVIDGIIKPGKHKTWWANIETCFDDTLAPWIDSDEPINAWDAFIVGQLSQHYAFSGMMAVRGASNVRMPAFDNRVFDIYLGMSPQQRIRGSAVYFALELISKDLSKLKNANTGFAASIGPWNEIFVQLSRGMLRKCKILQKEKLPSSKHSHGSWQNLGALYKDDPAHRFRLLDIRKRLDSLSFNLLENDALAKCIDDHLDGLEQHTKLLRQLITHDSWVQIFNMSHR